MVNTDLDSAAAFYSGWLYQVLLDRSLCNLSASASTSARTPSGSLSSLARLAALVGSASTAQARVYMGRRMADCSGSGRIE